MDCVSPTFPPLLAEYDERLFAGVRILYHRAHGRVLQGPGLPRGPHRRTPGEQDVRVARCALLAARCTPASLQGGMVLTMSVWGDAGSDMSWLDVSRVAGCSSCRL